MDCGLVILAVDINVIYVELIRMNLWVQQRQHARVIPGDLAVAHDLAVARNPQSVTDRSETIKRNIRSL